MNDEDRRIFRDMEAEIDREIFVKIVIPLAVLGIVIFAIIFLVAYYYSDCAAI